ACWLPRRARPDGSSVRRSARQLSPCTCPARLSSMPNKGKTVVLIACSSRKLDRSARARDLYQGTLFRASLDWAESQKPDEICILSAKYGLVDLEQVIEPYDLTLNALPIDRVRAWAERVFEQLGRRFDPAQDRFVFLAG